MPHMKNLGLFNIDGVKDRFTHMNFDHNYAGSIARLAEKSKGKDTTTGHWEIAGLISKKPFPTYPNGFPEEIIKEFEEKPAERYYVIFLIPEPK